MGVSETRNIDAVLTTTLANYRDKLYDNIFTHYPYLSWLNGSLGDVMRTDRAKNDDGEREVKRVVSGGETIVEQLLYGKSSAVKSYAGYDVLDTTPQDGMTIARFNWKQYAATITISGLEKRNNMGESQLIDLLQAKTTQAEMSLRDMMSTDSFGDGTGNNSKTFTGLKALVSTTATVGGLSPTTFTWWASQAQTAASFAANGLAAMRTLYNSCTFGNDRPSIGFTTQTVYEYYEALMNPLERITDTKVADLGFENLRFKGVPILWDRSCTAGLMYFLNSKYINLVVHEEADVVTKPFVTPENQDASTASILFQGNTTVNNRRMHGVLTVTAA